MCTYVRHKKPPNENKKKNELFMCNSNRFDRTVCYQKVNQADKFGSIKIQQNVVTLVETQ